VAAKEIEDEAMMLAAEMSRHDRKLVEMVDPSKENKIITTTKVTIVDPTAKMTKGKALAAMKRRTTKIEVHIATREAVVAAEVSHRTMRAKRGVTHPHNLQSPHGSGSGGGPAWSHSSKKNPP
jgi:hypothetical protein